MKYKVVLFLFLLVFCFSFANAADVRDASWGMSKEQVAEIEKNTQTLPLYGNGLGYSVELGGFEVRLNYSFGDKGLYRIQYVMMDDDYNDMHFIVASGKFRRSLIAKYGDPEGGIMKSLTPPFTWNVDGVEIELVYNPERFTFITIEYYNPSLDTEKDKPKKEVEPVKPNLKGF